MSKKMIWMFVAWFIITVAYFIGYQFGKSCALRDNESSKVLRM
ncbi:hypothetical protein [Prevotella koreensis]